MEQEPKAAHPSPAPNAEIAVPVTDTSDPALELRASMPHGAALSPIYCIPQRVQQTPPATIQEHAKESQKVTSNSSNTSDHVDHWYRKYLQKEKELADQHAINDQLPAENYDLNEETTSWRETSSRTEKSLQIKRREYHDAGILLEKRQQDVDKLRGLLQEANIRRQLEDKALVDQTMCLRVDIRNFSLQYGEIDENAPLIPSDTYSLLKEYIEVPERILQFYLASISARPPPSPCFNMGLHIQAGASSIQPPEGYLANPDARVEKGRITWRAKTIDLLLETMDRNQVENSANNEVFVRQEARILAGLLEPVVCRSMETILEPLWRLLNNSLALHRVLDQQVAMWCWCFPSEVPCKFDRAMHASVTQSQKGQIDEIQLVISPALMKRGKSSGDGFLVNEVHVKMEVELELSRPASSSSRSGWNPLNHLGRFRSKP
ncbi:uncharacterized protein N7483_006196 [Penicillium malachiteum]|uniref:uncharacterized protein n=1 Tax=Penicillium malachiteum TaxID=1324776 RepID=UPI002546CA32|nr:uncharacterized protein N7483_006196 [Penicillium malachiteum]KAJ5731688.1 hypothetical protein N7483_006196 [Penicillium malachiteum]